uniref:Uncharacterized protein At1g01500 n=1 Tax=Anthurium amnicola TaxID=1678845 RepID=A0A1D1ZD69_9ARAE
MEGCYSGLIDREQSDQKLIKHPLYQPRTSPWFDMRIFYLRISNFEVDDSTPEHLTLNYIPLSPDTILEVNGRRSSTYTEGVSLLLRRDRVDKKSEEATFVSTDNIRTTDSVRFEIHDKDGLLFSGVLELVKSNGFVGESKNQCKKWTISCQQVMTAGTGFLKGTQHLGQEAFLPIADVYVTGCFSGSPIILTKTLQLKFLKKHSQTVKLDSIREYEVSELRKDASSEALQVTKYCDHEAEKDVDVDYNSLYSRAAYLEGDDGELSWFNAGVRVGVGIGLGVCLGVGLGVGLLVRTYQATSRHVKRRLI